MLKVWCIQKYLFENEIVLLSAYFNALCIAAGFLHATQEPTTGKKFSSPFQKVFTMSWEESSNVSSSSYALQDIQGVER